MNNKSKKIDEKKDDLLRGSDNKVPVTLLYPAGEDIYNKAHKESDINPEDITKNKIPVANYREGKWNEKGFEEDRSGADLDVPGSELDDAQEKIGSEDEENNYYSIGGDNHNDLEENQG